MRLSSEPTAKWASCFGLNAGVDGALIITLLLVPCFGAVEADELFELVLVDAVDDDDDVGAPPVFEVDEVAEPTGAFVFTLTIG